jgi:SSS family solute:Na+ symporter
VSTDLGAAVPLQLAVLVGYSAALVVFGIWVSRRVTGSESFFVADRRLGAGLIFSTFLAANIGAGSIIGASGFAYDIGIAAWWWVGSAGIGSLLLALWVGPRIWHVAKEHGLYTAGDYLEHRYGSVVRGTVASLFWLITLIILAGQLIAMSEILEWVLDVPRWVGAVLGGLVMTAYFSAGGLLTSAWVNMVQLVVLLVGFAVGVPLALSLAGGWDAVVAAAPPDPEYLSFWSAAGLALMVPLVPAFIVSPGLLQKAFGAADERVLRTGIALHGVVLLIFAFAPVLVGMIARVYEPELANTDFAVPTVLTMGLPLAFGALGLAAVFSAEMSSADAVLFMLSTSLSKDIYKRYAAPDASDAQVLRVARYAAMAGGGLGVALAVVIPTVQSALLLFYSLLTVIFFVPIVVGLHTRRPGVPEALAAVAVGITARCAVEFSGLAAASAWVDPTLLGVMGSGLAFAVFFTVRRPAAGPVAPPADR